MNLPAEAGFGPKAPKPKSGAGDRTGRRAVVRCAMRQGLQRGRSGPSLKDCFREEKSGRFRWRHKSGDKTSTRGNNSLSKRYGFSCLLLIGWEISCAFVKATNCLHVGPLLPNVLLRDDKQRTTKYNQSHNRGPMGP